MQYNWQQKDWPHFQFNSQLVQVEVLKFTEQAGRISGQLKALSQDIQLDVVVSTLVSEAVKTSAIEGELLNKDDVVSSVRNNLGLNARPEVVRDKRAAGIAEMMVEIRETYEEPLSEAMLFRWHSMLMKGHRFIEPGRWRTGNEPMQVVSGAAGKETVHFEAPPSKDVPKEMTSFIQWYNSTAPGNSNAIVQAPVRAAVAHLYFETIHPFEDGNGRIGRAIAEKALSQNLGRPVVLSLSQVIEANKQDYYRALKKGQRTNKIDNWVEYFTNVILRAQIQAEEKVSFVISKTRFFNHYESKMNDRQRKVVQKMLDEGPGGVTGGMNARKYVSITKASKATATRDLQDLIAKGILKSFGKGRSTNYQVNINAG